MKKITLFFLGVGALLWAGGVSRAADPGQPERGRVLVLENERTLEGDVERVDDQYRVRRLVGETWVPAGQVLRLCASQEEAYAFLRGRANLEDPDERLRLADWCRLHGMKVQALAEVEAAVKLRPGHAPSKRLLGHLREAVKKPAAPVKPAADANDRPAPHVDLTADALGLFASKVQPILMNTCASCHANNRGGAFRLTRAYGAGNTNQRALQENLVAVLAQVRSDEPATSPFLTKAVSLHALDMRQAPLRDRKAPAYRALEAWVRLTLTNNPQLQRHDALPASPPAPPSLARTEPRWGMDRPDGEPTPPRKVGPALPAPPPVTAPAPATRPSAPDPVDPSDFNRAAHPARAGAPH
jgi:hypothetical protein